VRQKGGELSRHRGAEENSASHGEEGTPGKSPSSARNAPQRLRLSLTFSAISVKMNTQPFREGHSADVDSIAGQRTPVSTTPRKTREKRVKRTG